MSRIKEFFVCLLFNMLINLEWTIPAWILLVTHFVFGWGIMWFWIALGVWFLGIILWMIVIGWASKCSGCDIPKKNINPYSVGNKKE